MVTDDTPNPKTAAQVTTLLRERYAAPEFAFLPQVRSRTGYGGPIRTADAMAMGLYPSRGLELHGFEIKVSRSDWLRELKEPDKAEEIVRHCDRWWIAVSDEKIVAPGELPPTWGLLVPRRGKLTVKVEAPALPAAPMSRPFLAAILRNVADGMKDMVPTTEIDARIAAARKEGEERAAIYSGAEAARLLRRIESFEEKAGFKIDEYRGMHIGEAVRIVMADGLEQRKRELSAIRRMVKGMGEMLGREEE
jgi:hypothetical protein